MHRDLATLFKLRLGFFVVLSAVLGWFMATETMNIRTFLMLTLGGYALTGASNGLNQILERNIDGLMKRTANRPLPTGRMSVTQPPSSRPVPASPTCGRWAAGDSPCAS